jgi:hypothetical protein
MSAESAEDATPHQEPQVSSLPAPARPADSCFVFWTADRACCCAAKPAVVAVLPPSPERDHATDLLLCGHHYRAARYALAAVGATIMDETGQPVLPQDVALLGAG